MDRDCSSSNNLATKEAKSFSTMLVAFALGRMCKRNVLSSSSISISWQKPRGLYSGAATAAAALKSYSDQQSLSISKTSNSRLSK
ncbi:CLUMA_CG010746, isoform A [Clunio marinus]|uniref:CLUMA_CG010746, isoform A n=1 Tax=Clunio marinus TaxID=568069 RepID=A0A1J1IAW6_9DIPT|nr:CLUMA_CG010746, isoform A [Clunio marinus]